MRLNGVIAATLTFAPTTALAEVCDKERPLWSSVDGPATAIDELIGLSSTPIAIVVFVLTFVALVARWRIAFGTTGLASAALAFFVAMDRFGKESSGVLGFAAQEGCIGPPHLFIALSIAMSMGMTYLALRIRR